MVSSKKSSTFAADLVIINGAIAQLVEQRTENPCVPGSIPGGTTERNANDFKTRLLAFFFCLGHQIWQHLTNILILFRRF